MVDSTSKSLNAEQFLKQGMEIAQEFIVGASHYFDYHLNANPRPVVKVHSYYKTFDGSVVRVLYAAKECTCPVCSGCPQPHEEDELADPIVAASAVATAAGTQHDERQLFVCVVITGGHGHPRMQGTGPGEKFSVDDKGLAIVTNDCHDDGGPGRIEVIIKSRLCCVGLCLLREVAVKVEETHTGAVLDKPIPLKA